MKHLCSLLTVLLAFAAQAQEEAPDRRLTFTAGEVTHRWIPLTAPYEGDAPANRVYVVQAGTGHRFPTTVRDGKLTFVSEGATPGQQVEVVVKEEPMNEGDVHNVMVVKQADKDIIDVVIEDEHFTSYHYGKDWKKPFLWPINGQAGNTLTRDYPMDPEDKPADHPHHKSIWTAYGDVNGVDFWAEGEGSGNQVAQEVTYGSGDAYGWILSKNSWNDKDGNPVISETREYRFYATPDKARLFDVIVTFTANNGDAKFGDTKEGGLVALRMRQELSYRNAVITNAEGDVGEAKAWGKPSPWCDFSGDMEDVGWRGIAIFDHPSNMRHPTSWHVRQYGLNGANCFGYSYFREKDYNANLPENGDFLLKNGESFTMNYRVYVHSGDVERAKVADRYADYANTPEVKWVD